MRTEIERAIVGEFAAELARRLNRPAEQIVARGLSAYDFRPEAAVQLMFADGSHAMFRYAFTVTSADGRHAAVFTEHCGYHVFPAGAVRTTPGGGRDD